MKIDYKIILYKLLIKPMYQRVKILYILILVSLHSCSHTVCMYTSIVTKANYKHDV